MKYCTKCGKELFDEAVICPGCGCMVGDKKGTDLFSSSAPVEHEVSTLKTIAKVFMILGTVVSGIFAFLIPLAWCLPMTLSYCKKIKNGEPVSIGFKICSLLFVNVIAGILMLVDQD